MLVFVTLHYKVLCLECPLSADAWERASQALQCKDPNYYHCLRDDNDRVVEQCLGKLWIQPGMYRSQSMAANNYRMICDVSLFFFVLYCSPIRCLICFMILPGMCPEYNSRVTRIDVTECASPSCPQSVYWSNAVYLCKNS